MQKQNKALIRTAVIVLLFILLAIYLRFIGNAGTLPTFAGLVRSFIYIGLFGAWGVSVWRRIVQKQIRRYLLLVSILIAFWLVIRTIKFNLGMDLNVNRYIWYGYYIPMLFIPGVKTFTDPGEKPLSELDIMRGIFWRKRFVIPFIRVQNTDTKQGPIMRSFGLAQVTVSTAAGEHEIPGLEVEEADALRDVIATQARLAQEDL